MGHSAVAFVFLQVYTSAGGRALIGASVAHLVIRASLPGHIYICTSALVSSYSIQRTDSHTLVIGDCQLDWGGGCDRTTCPQCGAAVAARCHRRRASPRHHPRHEWRLPPLPTTDCTAARAGWPRWTDRVGAAAARAPRRCAPSSWRRAAPCTGPRGVRVGGRAARPRRPRHAVAAPPPPAVVAACSARRPRHAVTARPGGGRGVEPAACCTRRRRRLGERRHGASSRRRSAAARPPPTCRSRRCRWFPRFCGLRAVAAPFPLSTPLPTCGRRRRPWRRRVAAR